MNGKLENIETCCRVYTSLEVEKALFEADTVLFYTEECQNGPGNTNSFSLGVDVVLQSWLPA
jgi:hypothetical protein